jgi:hypothetical protein
MIVLSHNLILNPAGIELDTPIFGWRDFSGGFIEYFGGSGSAAEFPVTNLVNPSTALKWRGANEGPHGLFVYPGFFHPGEEVDYLAVAGHNFGTGQFTLTVSTVDISTSPFGGGTELVQGQILANNDPIIFRFEPFAPGPDDAIVLTIEESPNGTIPQAAVLQVGKLLVMPRSTHTDYAPLNLNIQSNVMTGKSETGNFLGRIVLSEQRGSPIQFNRLDALWYREEMQPFVSAAKADPFFFAWSPLTYPNECGYCWLTSDPQPTQHFETGTMGLTLQMNGLAI